MQGHAAANLVPVVASNRTGVESSLSGDTSIVFYGGSFIAGQTGEILATAPTDSSEAVMVAEIDLELAARKRAGWGLFRDRRPDLYGSILTLDGHSQQARHL